MKHFRCTLELFTEKEKKKTEKNVTKAHGYCLALV